MWPFKPRDPLAAIERIRTLNLQAGDILLVTMPEGYPSNMMNRASEMLGKYLGDSSYKVIVAQAGTEVSVVRPPKAEPPLGAHPFSQ